ncbi:MAG: DNA mismatch repair protein MutS [Candidatus Hydrogenedentes bacterium]|nr:DNA mismatch repair protein MutS [Candidatus Hydrogenedentota bacterium]
MSGVNTDKENNWLKITDVVPEHATPMLRQYLRAKAESGDSLLLFRMGDFYELFFEDAFEASRILGIALTSRDGESKEGRVPMCGVPVKSINYYLSRLIKAGKTVTVCEQVEDPKLARGIVKRAIVRTVTPGTVIEPELLEEGVNNFLASLVIDGDRAGLAMVDISTGEFLVTRLSAPIERSLSDELVRMRVVEILISESLPKDMKEFISRAFPGITITYQPPERYDAELCTENILRHFGLSTLKGLGIEGQNELITAVGSVLQYIVETQRDAVPYLDLPRLYVPSDYVILDSNTQRNLELVESLYDRSKKATLLGVLDRTLTPMGLRKLRTWILHPLRNVEEISLRLDAVGELKANVSLRLSIRELLKGVGDIERVIGRITAQTSNPRDLRALCSSLKSLPKIKKLLEVCESELLKGIYAQIDELPEVIFCIENAIVESPPNSVSDGGVIKDGYNAELDRLRSLMRGGREWIASLQKKERERTGIQNLRIGYNKVFGYYIEVSKGQTSLVPPDYQRKQTLVNAERYVTPELKSREEEILTAEERSIALEEELFAKVRECVSKEARRIQSNAEALALLDVLQSLAEVASSLNYSKPVVDSSEEIEIRGGRHPVIETLLGPSSFVPNDTYLNTGDRRLMIVTGPNMAGKSTYLRQVALITLMAQMGSFVPAEYTRIGVVDRIYTRVGASDNLARGESTFMVEMIETANILNTATSKSLLVLDEIGRGTSTYDGISIAWAVAEYIHNRIQARAMFATHYHELAELSKHLKGCFNVNVAVREYKDRIVFLYRVFEGASDHSYGIHVAKLAGLPAVVIRRANEIMDSLERGDFSFKGGAQQLLLFDVSDNVLRASPSPIEEEVRKIDPDKLSPKDALDLIYHWRKLLDKG